MSDDPGANRLASPWPVFVALGLTLSEVGIIVGVFTVAVGGLLLLGGSVAGILEEAGYTTDIWGSLLGFGVALLIAGGALFVSQLGFDPGAVGAVVANPGGFGQVIPRALAIAVAGLLLAAAGGVGRTLGGSKTGPPP